MKILLVEDDLYIRDLYKMILEKDNNTVLSAANGEEGLLLSAQTPDLIFLDVMLPQINGMDLLKKLKQNPATKNIPVIMLSNLGQDEIIKEALLLGAKKYLIKVNMNPSDILRLARQFAQSQTTTVS